MRDNPGLDASDLAPVYTHRTADHPLRYGRYPSGSACTLENIGDSGCVRPTGSYPETGLEEIIGDLLEADFGTALRVWSGAQLPSSRHSSRISGRVREGARNGHTSDWFGTEEFPFPKAGGRRASKFARAARLRIATR